MTATVFFAVIGAALLHAVWNALVKGSGDKHLSMAASVVGLYPYPLRCSRSFLLRPRLAGHIFAAGVLLHLGYNVFLLYAYRIGDLTQVYPIARGVAPLLVALISVVFLGVHLESMELLAVLLIGTGIISISLVRQKDGQRNASASLLALITGCFIASYSLVDGTGARLAETALGFYCWLSIVNSLVFGTFIALTKPGLLAQIPVRAKGVFLIGGNANFIAFAVVIWAFTQAPIALVTALRETSIIFALFIGVFFLKERLNLVKVCSTMVTLLGAALLRFSKHQS